MRTIRHSMLVLSSTLAIGSLVAAAAPAAAQSANPCAPRATANPCSASANDNARARAAAYSSVNTVTDCTKPFFDKKAPDGHVILQGMTPIEQEVCSTLMSRSK